MLTDVINSKSISITIAMIAANILLAFAFYDNHYFVEENGVAEIIQVLILIASIICFLYGTIYSDFKNIGFFCAAICLALILRELDVEDLDVNRYLIIIFSGTGRNILVSLLLLLPAYFIIRYYKARQILSIAIPSVGKFIIPFITFSILSCVFDKNIFHTHNNVLLEELSELSAYLIVFMSSIVYIRNFRLR